MKGKEVEEQEQSCRVSKKTVEYESNRTITETPTAKKNLINSKSLDERMKQTVAMYVAKRTEKCTQNKHSSNKSSKETKRSSETGQRRSGEQSGKKKQKRCCRSQSKECK